MGARSLKVFSQRYCLQETAEDVLVPPLGRGKRGKTFDFVPSSLQTAVGRAISFSLVANCQHVMKISSCDDGPPIST